MAVKCDILRGLTYYIQNTKPLLKIRKYKIRILYISKKTNLTAEKKVTILHSLFLLRRYTYVQ